MQFTTLIRFKDKNCTVLIAKNLISESIPIVTPDEFGSKVLALMEIFRISHLPVVVDKLFVGVISEKAIYDAENFENKIDKIISPIALQPYVYGNQHIFEVASIALNFEVSIVPVLDFDNTYIGSITREVLALKLSELFSSSEPGGIIVLELLDSDYSLSQISQIIEGNDARILSLYISKKPGASKKMEVTIKVSAVDLSGIIQTFTRYDYLIKATYQDQSENKSFFDDRYDLLMRYINT